MSCMVNKVSLILSMVAVKLTQKENYNGRDLC